VKSYILSVVLQVEYFIHLHIFGLTQKPRRFNDGRPLVIDFNQSRECLEKTERLSHY
jgi:hypothetical protein